MPTGISLTQNQVAIVDSWIYPALNEFKWYARYAGHTKSFYAARNKSRKENNGRQIAEYLAWYIIGEPLPGFVVDHINGNTLDNRKENLRVVTNRQNMQNKKIHREGKLVGVSLHKKTGLWRARVKINGREKSLGYFKTPQEANLAYWGYIGGHLD